LVSSEGDRRHREVVDELRVPPSDLRALASTSSRLPGSVLKPPPAKNTRWAKESHGLLRLRAELGEHVVDVGAEVLVRDVAAAVADQQPLLGQQALEREPVERRQHHALGQVAGRAEQDEDRRTRIGEINPSTHACSSEPACGPAIIRAQGRGLAPIRTRLPSQAVVADVRLAVQQVIEAEGTFIPVRVPSARERVCR
jgi:hypothetical protein